MRKLLGIITTVFVIATAVIFAGAGTAAADPSASDWKALRQCESGDRYTINTGNGYYGAYQFDLSTWRGVGGSGRPDQASKSEQDYRALRLYRLRGWAPWICADLVGLKNDSDAGSGRVPPAPGGVKSGGGTPAAPSKPSAGSSAPAWSGHTYVSGDFLSGLKAWQKQMGKMGYGLTGTGYFGSKTEAAVRALQKKAGLNVVGYIGAKTWAAAWDPANKKGAAATTKKPAVKATPTKKPTTYVPATNASCKVGARTAPSFKGVIFRSGHTYRDLQCFQRQLGHLGYGLTGTGFYGAKTKAAVTQLQRKYHIPVTGYIGAATWKAAWQGSRK